MDCGNFVSWPILVGGVIYSWTLSTLSTYWVCRFFLPETNWGDDVNKLIHMAMDQYLLIPFLMGWTSIYQLFWCSPGVQGFDTSPYVWRVTPPPMDQHSYSFLVLTASARYKIGPAVFASKRQISQHQTWEIWYGHIYGWWFRYFTLVLFNVWLIEMSFAFWDGLKPPTRYVLIENTQLIQMCQNEYWFRTVPNKICRSGMIYV